MLVIYPLKRWALLGALAWAVIMAAIVVCEID